MKVLTHCLLHQHWIFDRSFPQTRGIHSDVNLCIQDTLLGNCLHELSFEGPGVSASPYPKRGRLECISLSRHEFAMSIAMTSSTPPRFQDARRPGADKVCRSCHFRPFVTLLTCRSLPAVRRRSRQVQALLILSYISIEHPSEARDPLLLDLEV